MKKNNGVIRKPVIRKAILLSGVKFQTIASHNENYNPCVVMGTYSDILDARSHYVEDMNQLKLAGENYKHFAIKQVNPEPLES